LLGGFSLDTDVSTFLSDTPTLVGLFAKSLGAIYTLVNKERGTPMREPLQIQDIAGLSLTITGTLIEQYVKRGYADPTMYKALRACAELTEHFLERVTREGSDSELIEGVSELLNSLRLTAMECGEVVNRIIDEHDLPIDKDSWSKPHADCDHEHESDN